MYCVFLQRIFKHIFSPRVTHSGHFQKRILSNPVASNHYNSKLKVLCAHPVRTPVFYQSGSPYEDGVLSFSLSRFAGADCRAAHVMTRTVIHHGKMDVLIDEQKSFFMFGFQPQSMSYKV